MIERDKTNLYTAYTDDDTGHNERKEEISQEAIDYLNTKMASRFLYRKKYKVAIKEKLPIKKALLPRKVI
jgi:hypothetical protein